MHPVSSTSWHAYQALEDEKQRLISELKSGDRLLLVKAQNNLNSVATVRAALALGKSAGLIDPALFSEFQRSGETQTTDNAEILCSTKAVPGPGIVCFTSGSTGSAKGIERSVESWINTYDLQRRTLNQELDASVLILGNIAHSLHFYAAMEALDREVVPNILSSFTPKRVIDACVHGRPEILYATPSHIGLILAQTKTYLPLPLDSVRLILTGGAKFNERNLSPLRDVFPEATIIEFFGTTETSYMTIKEPFAPKGSVGKQCDGVDIQVRGIKNQLLPTGQEGTLWVKSNMLFSRYIVGEDLNTRWQDGYLTIGDQGFLDEAGHLYFTARTGSMVTVAGENVYLDKIERLLNRFVLRGEAVVVPITNKIRGNQLVAMTQFKLPDNLKDEALKAMRAEFGHTKSPRTVLHVPIWPFLPSGKVDRQHLAGLAAEILAATV